jgi:anti-anti-sigma factor
MAPFISPQATMTTPAGPSPARGREDLKLKIINVPAIIPLRRRCVMSKIDRDGEKTIAVIDENLIDPVAQELRPALQEALRERTGELVIDLTGVEVLDSHGLGFLIAARNSMNGNGSAFRLINAGQEARKLLTNMRLDAYLGVADA